MYEELQTLDMRNSNGVFAITVNDGSGARTDSTGFNLDKVFSNQGSMTFDPTTCSAGNIYAPNQSDGRNLSVSFKDETMTAYEPMPSQKINFVPFAFEAKHVAGFDVGSLVRVVDVSGNPVGSLSPLSNANYTELLALIAGTSTQYPNVSSASFSGNVNLNSNRITGVANPTAATDAVNRQYVDGDIAGKVADTVTLAALAVGDAGKVLSWNGTQWTAATPTTGGFVNGGNSFGATSNLGNNDNFDLNIKTNNLTRMSVVAGGNVGIGTTAPSTALDVNGTIATSSFAGLESTLSAGISAGATTVALVDASSYPPTGLLFLYVGGVPEIVSYSGKAGNTLTGLSRGKYGTTAQAISSGTSARLLRLFIPVPGGQPGGLMVFASGAMSIGVPEGNYRPGGHSLTMGFNSRADGNYAFAQGNGARAIGWVSMASGSVVTATGDSSQSFGINTTSDAYAQHTIGQFNLPKSGESANSWVATDPLFVVGNGLSAGAKSNAMMILKNGNVGIGTTSPAGILHVDGGTAAAATNGTDITLKAQNSGSGSGNGGNIQLTPGAGVWSGGGVYISTIRPANYGLPGLTVSRRGVGSDNYTATGAVQGPPTNLVIGNDYYNDGNTAIMGMTTGSTAVTQQRGYFGTVSTSSSAYSPIMVWGQQTAASTYSERMRMDVNGNVGIGTTAPRGVLDVNGTLIEKAEVVNAGTTIDFGTGNIQYTTNSCGGFQLNNLKDGGSYTFIVKGTTPAICTFTGFSDAGSTPITVHMPPDNGTTTNAKHTIYNVIVGGTDAYVAWTPGY